MFLMFEWWTKGGNNGILRNETILLLACMMFLDWFDYGFKMCRLILILWCTRVTSLVYASFDKSMKKFKCLSTKLTSQATQSDKLEYLSI